MDKNYHRNFDGNNQVIRRRRSSIFDDQDGFDLVAIGAGFVSLTSRSLENSIGLIMLVILNLRV